MRWSFYRMKPRDRMVCLLLYIVFWLIAIVCDSAEGMTEVRAEIQSLCQFGDFELRKELCVPIAPDSPGGTVVTFAHRHHGGNLVSTDSARNSGIRTHNTPYPTPFLHHHTSWKGSP